VFDFQRTITVTNPYNHAMVNEPVFVPLDFAFSHVASASIELKLTNQTGQEIPSYILDEQSTQGFVTSAWILFLLTLPPSSAADYVLHFGNSSASPPSYRVSAPFGNLRLGRMSVGRILGGFGSSSIQVTFGDTYTQSIYYKVSYQRSNYRDYGSLQIAQNPLHQISSFQVVGNVSNVPLTVTSGVYTAGDLRYVRVALLYNHSLSNVLLLTNTGSSPLGSLTLTEVIDSAQLSSSGNVITQFDIKSGVLSSRVADAFIGYKSQPSPDRFDVGSESGVFSQVKSDKLGSGSQATGITAAALRWSLGTIQPGSREEVRTRWAIAANPDSLTRLVAVDSGPDVKVGPELPTQRLVPHANSIWNTSISFSNFSIPQGGVTLPMIVKGSQWLPPSLSVGGYITYVLPSADFSPSSGVWNTLANSVGNATASSSSAFWSIERGTYLGRLVVQARNYTSAASAELYSHPVATFAASSQRLVLSYKASVTGGGNLSAQSFYASIDLDHSLNGTFDQSLILPLFGTSQVSARSRCGPLTFPNLALARPNRNITRLGYLVADGVWRTFSVDLTKWSRSNGVAFQIRFCNALTKAYIGQMELDLQRSEIVTTSVATNVLTTSLDYVSPLITVSFVPLTPYSVPSSLFTGVISFCSVQRTQMNATNGVTFSTPIGSFNRVIINGTLPGVRGLAPVTSFQGTAIHSIFALRSPVVLANETALKTVLVSSGSVYVGADTIRNSTGKTVNAATRISISFSGYDLMIKATDANGDTVSSAVISVTSPGVPARNMSSTDASGSSTLHLLPWNYSVSLTFHGSIVASFDSSLTGDQNVPVHTTVFRVFLSVKDSFKSPLAGASVRITRGILTVDGFTDKDGRFSFQAASNQLYHVTVMVAGNSYYDGDVRASYNNLTIELSSSYFSPEVQLYAVAAITISLFAAGILLYFRRRPPLFRGFHRDS
jgi:hypothetical protein